MAEENPAMGIKVTVTGRFVYDGKTYGSLEELPENVRQAYEEAMSGAAAGLPGPGGASGASRKIAFNGTEYERSDAMPPEVRSLYETVIGAVESGRLQGGNEPPIAAGLAPGPTTGPQSAKYASAAPIEPGSGSSRSTPIALVIGLAVFLLLLGLYLYTSAVPK